MAQVVGKSGPMGETRADRARIIASTPDAVKKVKEGLFAVKSQTGFTIYKVEHDHGWRCTCPDHVARGVECKHILATRYYLEVQKDTSQGTVSEKIRLTHSQAWTAYNAAQQDEVRLFDSLLKDLVAAIPEREQKMGRPRLPIHDQLFCAIQKVYSQLSSRRARSLFKNANERGQIGHAPHFNAPSKLFNDPTITPILHDLITQSALPVAELETDFAIDSTGFRTTTFSSYDGEKYGQRRRNLWLKAHFCTGVKTNIVTSMIVTEAYGADVAQFQPLIERTAEGFKIREVAADGAYSSRGNLEAVDRLGGVAFIPFKRGSTPLGHGSLAWKKMYHFFQLHREEFMEHYHKRSNVESTNAALKRKFGETLKSKNVTAQINELLAKVVAYNLTVVIHEMYENGVEPDFLHLKSMPCTQTVDTETL